MRDLDRRRFVAAAASVVAGGKLGLLSTSTRMTTMTDVMPELETIAEPGTIRPFHCEMSDLELADLNRRIKATRWPDRELVADDSQGVQLATMQKLAQYWANDYNWRRCEAKLNALPQFITEIDGLDIHFIHVRSKHDNALPIIITHGWPGSIIEQLKIIEPLTNPTAHGGTAADAFHVVIPSLPGYGFSAIPKTVGWNPPRIVDAWITLMTRLGYQQFVAQGGDWGNAISEIMALKQPPGLLGIHTNMPATVPPEIAKALAFHEPRPATLSPEERNAWDQLTFFYGKGLGYANEMNNRPQTLYGIADSPIALAAWMLDHDATSERLIARVFDGKPAGLSRDDILDNITLYWLTNTGVSSGRLYWEAAQLPAKGGFFDARGVKIPVAVSAFAGEIYTAPETWAKRAYQQLIYYKHHDTGIHFAAWETPQLLVEDVRAGFKPLRSQLTNQKKS